MNVSRNAYFTSQYLEQRLPARAHRDGASPQVPRSIPNSPLEPTSLNHTIDNPDELVEEITPAELNYLAPKPKRTRRNRRLVDYYDYYAKPQRHHRTKLVEPALPESSGEHASISHDLPLLDSDSRFLYEPESLYEPSVPEQKGYSGFYIDQKKRFDESEEVKPTMYTHKTFRNVFGKDTEERLNPIDIVFDDPEDEPDLEASQKLTKALKSVQRKMGKKDYRSYDYFQQKQIEIDADLKRRELEEASEHAAKAKSKKGFRFGLGKKKKVEAPKEIFVENVSEDDSDYEVSGLEPAAATGEQPPKSLKKQLRRKWKNAKKTVGDNYFDNYKNELEQREQLKEAKEAQKLAEKEVEAVLPAPPLGVGPQAEFHPLWNYMLSWLVYNHASPENKQKSSQIDELLEDEGEVSPPYPTTKLAKTKKPKNSQKAYRELLRNWNQPASGFFTGSIEPRQAKQLVASDPMALEEDYPLEYEVDISDGEGLEDQLIYNPKSGRLEPLSKSYVASDTLSVETTGKLYDGPPTAIMSNINKLIKHIKIMKIVFAPIDLIAEYFPRMQTIVILLELVIFVWILYELSLLIDALCMAIKAVCAPMIAIGKFMNRIV